MAGPPGTETVEARRERFVRLTMPHMEALYRTALYMTGRRERAEDAVQEAYLRAWRYFETFGEGRDAKVWLFAILRNAIFEAARKRRREPAAASLDEVGPENVGGRFEPPDARLGDREIVEAIERLPEEFRIVVLLAVVEDMKYREIAEALDIPIGTVMSRLYRGRRLLKWRLRAYAEKGGSGAEDGQGQVA
jgi:RNA polymerase sigma-70 factor (ECF subfamily)